MNEIYNLFTLLIFSVHNLGVKYKSVRENATTKKYIKREVKKMEILGYVIVGIVMVITSACAVYPLFKNKKGE